MIPESVKRLLHDFRPGFSDRWHRVALWLVGIGAAVVPVLIYGGVIRITNIEFLNGMAWQRKAKTQSVSRFFANGVTQQAPVAGTVPRGVRRPWNEPTTASLALLENPLAVSERNLRRGRRVFEDFCVPCHGFKGLGDGGAVGEGRLAAPASLHSDKARAYRDGEVFSIVTLGQNNMPSYAKQIEPDDRWAAVLYVRVLQRALAPTDEDIEAQAKEEEAP